VATHFFLFGFLVVITGKSRNQGRLAAGDPSEITARLFFVGGTSR